MNRWISVAAVLACWLSPPPAQSHAPRYVVTTFGNASALYWSGVWPVDAGTTTVKHLTPGHRTRRGG